MQIHLSSDVLSHLPKIDVASLKVGQKLPVEVVSAGSEGSGKSALIKLGGQEIEAKMDTSAKPGDRFWVAVRELGDNGLVLSRGQSIPADLKILPQQMLTLLSRGLPFNAEIAGILDKFQNNPQQLVSALRNMLEMVQNPELKEALSQLLRNVPQWETISSQSMLNFLKNLGVQHENGLFGKAFAQDQPQQGQAQAQAQNTQGQGQTQSQGQVPNQGQAQGQAQGSMLSQSGQPSGQLPGASGQVNPANSLQQAGAGPATSPGALGSAPGSPGGLPGSPSGGGPSEAPANTQTSSNAQTPQQTGGSPATHAQQAGQQAGGSQAANNLQAQQTGGSQTTQTHQAAQQTGNPQTTVNPQAANLQTASPQTANPQTVNPQTPQQAGGAQMANAHHAAQQGGGPHTAHASPAERGGNPSAMQMVRAAQENDTFKSMLLRLLETSAQNLTQSERGMAKALLDDVTAQQFWLQSGIRKNALVLLNVPLQDQEGWYQAQIAIESGRKGSKMDPEHCRIGVQVETYHLGTVGADVWIYEGRIHLCLLSDDPAGLIEAAQSELMSAQEQFQALGMKLASLTTKNFSDMPRFRSFLAGEQLEVNVEG
jgi:hypothetical protein